MILTPDQLVEIEHHWRVERDGAVSPGDAVEAIAEIVRLCSDGREVRARLRQLEIMIGTWTEAKGDYTLHELLARAVKAEERVRELEGQLRARDALIDQGAQFIDTLAKGLLFDADAFRDAAVALADGAARAQHLFDEAQRGLRRVREASKGGSG